MHDKGQEAVDFLKGILSELQTMNQVNQRLLQQNAQLTQQQANLTQQLVANAAQERDTQTLLAQLGHRIGELSELLVEDEEVPPGHYPPTPYQHPTLGEHLMSAGMEAIGIPPRPRRGRRRRSG